MVYVDIAGASVDIPIYDSRTASLKAQITNLNWRGGRINFDNGAHVSVRALSNIGFRLEDGDRVGLVGRNGSGKTTLLRVLAGIYEPTSGQVRVAGSICALLDLTLGMDVDATGLENIYLRGYALGLSHREIQALEQDIADFTELGPYLTLPVRTYSSGMAVRLAFSISLSAPHDILLLDEVIGAGDAAFLAKARKRLEERLSRARILVLASHSPEILRGMCSKGIYLQAGQIAAIGPIGDVLDAYARNSASPGD